MRVQPGSIIIEEGEESQDVYFVFSGRLAGVLMSEEGKEVAFADIGPGSHFGEMSALDGEPRSLTISARTEAELGRVDGKTFVQWMVTDPIIASNVARAFARWTRQLNKRLFGLVVYDVGVRVRLLLSRLAQAQGELKPRGRLKPAPTRDDMANYVGANREAVSRVMAQLARDGIITTGRQEVCFLDVDQLLDGL